MMSDMLNKFTGINIIGNGTDKGTSIINSD